LTRHLGVVVTVATSELDGVEKIAARLRALSG
jgi:hypothetical protein